MANSASKPRSTGGRKPRRVLGKNLVKLSIDSLIVDHKHYQRERVDKHVKALVDVWDERLFTPPIIGQRITGEYVVLDGQQRTTAAKYLGYDDVLAILLQPRTIQEEAALFTQMNQGSLKLKPRDLHKANVAAQEPIAMMIEEILGRYKLTAIASGNDRTVSAIGRLRGAWGPRGAKSGVLLNPAQLQYGAEVLTWAIEAGSPMLNTGGTAAQVYSQCNLSALIWVRQTARDVPDLEEMKAALTGVDPKWLRYRLADTSVPGGTMVARWGTRLGDFANQQNGKETVKLPIEAIERLQAMEAALLRKAKDDAANTFLNALGVRPGDDEDDDDMQDDA